MGLTAPAAEVSLRVEAAGQTTECRSSSSPLFGAIVEEVGVPDCREPMDVKVTAMLGGQSEDGHGPRPAAAQVADLRGPQLAHRHRLHRHPAQVRRAAQPEHRHGHRPVQPLPRLPLEPGSRLAGRELRRLAQAASGWTISTASPARAGSASRPSTATSSPGLARTRRPAG